MTHNWILKLKVLKTLLIYLSVRTGVNFSFGDCRMPCYYHGGIKRVLLAMEFDDNASRLLWLSSEYGRLGTVWTQLQHAASLLEETKTRVRAQIANRIRFENPKLARRDAEEQALLSDDYMSHIQAMVDARLKANQARVELEVIKTEFDAVRTAEVSRRAEMNKYQA
jgi:hypothetical protein